MTEEKSSKQSPQQTSPAEVEAEVTADTESVIDTTEAETPIEENKAQEKSSENFKVNIPDDIDEIADKAQEETKAVVQKPAAKAPSKKARPATRKRMSDKTKKQIKSEKSAKNAVIILSCLMAVITVATAVLGATTDIFKAEDVKAVAVLILPQEDKEELERHLAKLWSLTQTGFDTETMSGEELFGYIKPGSKNGLYSGFGYSAETISDIPDPAERFADEQGNYAYYKIKSDEIDSILLHFGLETNHALNSEKVYYYDGFYYFMSEESENEAAGGKVTVLDSKRIQDGRYYVTSKFGKKEIYVIASMHTSDEGNFWEIHSMSLKPVFDNLGIMIKNEDENSGNYEMRQVVIEGKADDGSVFRKYVVKYPYFFGETQGEIQANNFYSSIITFYRQQAEQVQSDYKKFIKKGGKKDSLPIELHYTATLSFMDDKNISLISEITESVPMYKTDSEDENASIQLGNKTVECNAFDVETGLYVSKDALVGKDYVTLSALLYRIYSGYGYQALIDSTVSDESVPSDIYKLGEKIYNSAVAMSNDGYVFCYIGSDGLRKDVVVPFEVIEKLNQKD